jgi:Kef-type K+ transport system membrane component KefB
VILALLAALVTAADAGSSVSLGAALWIAGKALVFLVVALALGVALAGRVYRLAARLRTPGVLLALSLSFCFALAWAADAIGLASIVGAFAAGLVLEKQHSHGFVARGERPLDELLQPIASFLVPVFFVVMGVRTELRVFGDPSVLVLAASLSLVAIASKQAGALGVRERGVDRLLVGIGMVPRGEVGLIFANVGLGLSIGGRPLIDASLFAAVVVVVIVTTLVTPPLLKWRLGAGS